MAKAKWFWMNWTTEKALFKAIIWTSHSKSKTSPEIKDKTNVINTNKYLSQYVLDKIKQLSRYSQYIYKLLVTACVYYFKRRIEQN